MKTNHKHAQEPTDRLVRSYVEDNANFLECWEFEAADGASGYTYCMDQWGGDAIKHEWSNQ